MLKNFQTLVCCVFEYVCDSSEAGTRPELRKVLALPEQAESFIQSQKEPADWYYEEFPIEGA